MFRRVLTAVTNITAMRSAVTTGKCFHENKTNSVAVWHIEFVAGRNLTNISHSRPTFRQRRTRYCDDDIRKRRTNEQNAGHNRGTWQARMAHEKQHGDGSSGGKLHCIVRGENEQSRQTSAHDQRSRGLHPKRISTPVAPRNPPITEYGTKRIARPPRARPNAHSSSPSECAAHRQQDQHGHKKTVAGTCDR